MQAAPRFAILEDVSASVSTTGICAPAPPGGSTLRHTLSYIVPFAVYAGFMAAQQLLGGSAFAWLLCRSLFVLLAIALFSRSLLPLSARQPLWSVLVGVGVFAVWIVPDLLWPGYRAGWQFQNALTGGAQGVLAQPSYAGFWFVALRVVSSVLLVPVLEELFWRGWLLRWIVDSRFLSVPAGTYNATAFWVTAFLFASEHGPYWDVGLLAGIAYNCWMLRTRNLGDLMLAHGVTNGCLALYVLVRGQWQYWL